MQEVLVTGIITILFAKCASWVAEGKYDTVKQKLGSTINHLIYLLIPASFGIIVCSELIVTCFFSRGEFDENSVLMTSQALCCYTVGLAFMAVRDTIIKVFYAYKETKITTVTSVFTVVINIVLNLILSRMWGINGLAIATSISAVAHCIALYFLLRKKIGDFQLKTTAINALKIFISSLAMFLMLKLLIFYLTRLDISKLVILVIAVFIGILLYALMSLILRVDTAKELLNNIKNRINKK